MGESHLEYSIMHNMFRLFFLYFARDICLLLVRPRCLFLPLTWSISSREYRKPWKKNETNGTFHVPPFFFLEKSTAFFRFEKGPTKEKKKIFPIVDIDSSRRYLRRYNPTTTKEGQRMYTWLNNDLCNRENICKVHFTCNVHEAKKNLFIYICNLTGSMLLSNVRICIQDASTFFFPIYVYNICRM